MYTYIYMLIHYIMYKVHVHVQYTIMYSIYNSYPVFKAGYSKVQYIHQSVEPDRRAVM